MTSFYVGDVPARLYLGDVECAAQPGPGRYQLWDDTDVPGLVDVGDPNPAVLGTVVEITAPCRAVALRHWRAASTSAESHPSRLWSGDGMAVLASATFPPAPGGWQEVALPVPVMLAAGQTVVPAFWTSTNYGAQLDYFTAPRVSGPLRGVVGHFAYGQPDMFPREAFRQASYFAGLVVEVEVEVTAP